MYHLRAAPDRARDPDKAVRDCKAADILFLPRKRLYVADRPHAQDGGGLRPPGRAARYHILRLLACGAPRRSQTQAACACGLSTTQSGSRGARRAWPLPCSRKRALSPRRAPDRGSVSRRAAARRGRPPRRRRCAEPLTAHTMCAAPSPSRHTRRPSGSRARRARLGAGVQPQRGRAARRLRGGGRRVHSRQVVRQVHPADAGAVSLRPQLLPHSTGTRG